MLEIKETFGCGFKHIRTDKIDNFIIFGCDSDCFLLNTTNYSSSGLVTL